MTTAPRCERLLLRNLRTRSSDKRAQFSRRQVSQRRTGAVAVRLANEQDVFKDDSDRLSALRDHLRDRLGAERFDLWLGPPAEMELNAGVLHVHCASRAEVQWIRRKLLTELSARCSEFLGANVEVSLHVKRAPAPTAAQLKATACEPAQVQPLLTDAPRNRRPACQSDVNGACHATASPSALPPRPPRKDRWTFGTFVAGAGNRLALHTAAETAAHPGRYSPLLLFGPAGTGKTHLLEAIAHDARRRGAVRGGALFATAEQFTAQFLDALERRMLPSFRDKFRSLGMLLVDDVQFFAGKRATLEELLHTIDSLARRDAQVVLASDRAPAELQSVSSELTARLGAGLAVQLDPPDYSTRLGVVRGIAQRLELNIDDNVLQLVAQQVVGSARLLGGAINRLVAASMARSTAITLELATEALADFTRQHAPQVRLADIQRAVCEVFGVEPKRLKSDSRARAVADPRTLAMWLARKYTRAALSEIGDYFGRRSHSTVVAAQKRFDQLIRREATLTVDDAPCGVEEVLRRVENVLRTG